MNLLKRKMVITLLQIKKFDANGRLLCLKNNGKLAKFDDSVFNENEKKLLRESEVEVKANSLVLVAMGA